MLHARGQYLLMVDADAATQISDLDRLEAALLESQRDGAGLAVGSRSHLQDDAVAKVTHHHPTSATATIHMMR
jgi:dolichyl-phosphate beta-glucosyltransferase